MNILLVVDLKESWAIQNRAKNLAKNLQGHDILILNKQELTPFNMEEYFVKFDIIQFCFTGHLTHYLKWFKKYPNCFFTSIVSYRSIEGYWDNVDEMKEVFLLSANTVCLTKKLYEWLKENVNSANGIFIPNGVDIKLFKPKPFIVGFVGRKIEYKGYDLIKQACDELEGVEFMPDRNEYPNKILSQEELVQEYYNHFDCLAIASVQEGSHNPTLEALACNIPVISTRIGNSDDFKEGIVFVERNVKSIKEGILKIMELKKSNKIRDQILEDYTWEKITKKYKKMWSKNLKHINNMKNEKIEKKLNIGAGGQIKQGYINLDIRELDGIDIIADITEELKFDNNYFDEILATEVLEHIKDEKLFFVISEIFRVLKKGGKFVFGCPDVAKCSMALTEENISEKEKRYAKVNVRGETDDENSSHNHHFNHLTENYLKFMLNQAGFSQINNITSHEDYEDWKVKFKVLLEAVK